MINLKLNGITLQLDDATALIDLMTAEDRSQVIESLSCYDDVIKHVADQISLPYGCTEGGCSGSTRCGPEIYAGKGTPLDLARYEVARTSSDSAAQYIDRQAEIILTQKAEIEKLQSTIHAMLNPARPSAYP